MIKTFTKGGVHPPENKLSSKTGIENLTVPDKVVIPLCQHLGAPSTPIVERGDMVKTGQLIAKSQGFISSKIHSSVSGKILKIDKELDTSGYKKDSIVIQVEGDEWDEEIDTTNDFIEKIAFDKKEILQKISDAGVVGLGGATFPSHIKLDIPRGGKINCLIINGVECEPYLTADHALMLHKGKELMIGIQIMMKVLNVKEAVIGIENNKPDAIRHLSKLSAGLKGIKVIALKVKYPQGGEKQLIKALLKREVPSGGLPLDVGAVVFNIGTTFAIYEAVQKNKPLIDRVVTVTGKHLQKPSNFKVRIGTPVSALIEAAGGIPGNTGKIISGGPMMGKALSDVNIPIVKGSSGILILEDKESIRKKIQPCIRCSKCISVCPMGLEPYFLMPLSEKEFLDKLEFNKVMDCIECGSCSYICPSSRPLLDYIRLGKARVGKIIRTRKEQ